MNLKLTRKQVYWLLAAFWVNALVYLGGRFLAQNAVHFSPVTSWDLKIPFLPWTILIYLGCYLFWVVNYCIGVKYDKGNGYRFLGAHMIGEAVCFLCFVCFPTSMVRPEITGTSFFDLCLRVTYLVDVSDNLFPSIHCFASWLCWIAVRGNENVPKWYRVLSFVIAVSVCISTLTVKQHLIVDVPSGILVAEVSYLLARFLDRKKT